MPARSSYFITVFGGKDGIGKTIMSANIAEVLGRETRGNVLLIDFDTRGTGDIPLLLGMKGLTSMIDILPSLHKISPNNFISYIARYKNRFHVLPGWNDIKHLKSLSPDKLASMVEFIKNAFNFVIIDLGSEINPVNIKLFEQSSLIMFLTTPEILSLNQSMVTLSKLQTMHVPSDLIKVVLNKYNPKDVITEAIVESKLKRRVLGAIPYDPETVTASVHQGVPFVSTDPKAEISKKTENIIRKMAGSGSMKPASSMNLSASSLFVPSQGTFGKGSSSSSVRNREYLKGEKDLDFDRSSAIKLRIHQKLIEIMDLKSMTPEALNKADEKQILELKEKTTQAIARIIDGDQDIRTSEERQKFAKEVLDEALGLGPLEDLIEDSAVSEIMVNGKDQIFVEVRGKLTRTNLRFTSNKHLLGVIERIVAPVGRRIEEKTPMVDARLHDGSRVHAIIPPLALNGPTLTIRKFAKEILGWEQLVKLETITKEIADFLRGCVEARLNILISGGTGSGKTTLLNIMSSFIPQNERIITVEDSAELQLDQEHVVSLESRPANLQGEGSIDIRELVRNSLRMRPDRIIVGECRGGEALDMLQAMNTGHDGSMTTIHANNPHDCMGRLETLVMFTGMELPSKAIREQISSAINLVVQLNRFSDGSRKISHITEVTGLEGQNLGLQNIFTYKQKGIDKKGRVIGAFQPTGLVPKFMDKFREKGIRIPLGMFGGKGDLPNQSSRGKS